MSRDLDVAVVGLGGIGSAAAYWLARRLGDRVAGFEQFELGHSNGASQDHSRIIRLSYHRPDYVRLSRRAYVTWSIVEAESRQRVILMSSESQSMRAYLCRWREPVDRARADVERTTAHPRARREVRATRARLRIHDRAQRRP